MDMELQDKVCWICFPMRDGIEPMGGELAEARRRFLLDPKHTVSTRGGGSVKGFSGRLRGKLGRRVFYWSRKVRGAPGGEVVLEEAFVRRDGWAVVTRDLMGVIVSRNFFDKKHRWVRTEYYEPWDAVRARVSFTPGDKEGTVLRRDWDPMSKHYRDLILHCVPYRTGTAGQSVVDAQLGEPQLLAVLTDGDVCFCPEDEAKARQESAEKLQGGTVVLMPAWEIKGGELVREESDDGEDISFTSLEEYAKIEPKEDTAPAPAPEAAQASPADDGSSVSEPSVPEDSSPEQPGPAPEPDLEPAPLPEDEVDLEAILAEAALYSGPAQPAPGDMAIPEGYTGDIKDGKVTGRGRVEQRGGMTSYEGEYLDGKRHGFGTYYYKDGNLCYAGTWKDDRRDGLGVSFRDSDHALHVSGWKDGQPEGLVTLFDSEGNLRYSGRMENGKKEGAGVAVSGKDGTVFVGQWAGGEATGLGSAFDREGRLLYYGGWQDGKRHGRGTEFDINGGVVFDGEFKDGKYYNGVLYQKLQNEQ